jgi:hypothetical protein
MAWPKSVAPPSTAWQSAWETTSLSRGVRAAVTPQAESNVVELGAPGVATSGPYQEGSTGRA